MDSRKKFIEFEISEYRPQEEPFYLDVDEETEDFMAAYKKKVPIILKGPTGCGKSRLVEKMAYTINKMRTEKGEEPFPLVTVPCQEDLDADDLKGRYLKSGKFKEGPALIAVKRGGILYLDEVVEARNDIIVVVHPLTDHRRILVVEDLGKVFEAPDSFAIVMSYNPGYQRKIKDLKQSTKQRPISLNLGYPPEELEKKIVMHEAGTDKETAECLVKIGDKVRNLKGKGLDEGASTRLLINAAKMIEEGRPPMRACEVAILNPLADDLDVYKDIRQGLEDVIENYFP